MSHQDWKSAHIGELGEVCIGGSHAQVLTYLTGKVWARIAREYESVAHLFLANARVEGMNA